ncbi:hypothetical protein [Catellatospora coxensis]|uniref:WXG100-like domain-containing protein n=1 Tax=Catellatospora coxensis TaxID=310354 RepID=UPI0031D286C4
MREFFLIVTGESWPQGDEDQLRALGRLYGELARILVEVEQDLAAIEAVIAGGGWKGDAEQASLAHLKKLRNGGGLRKLAEAAEKMSRFAFDAGANVEYAKASILGQLAILTAQILMLLPWVSFPPTSAQASTWISQLIAFGRYMSATFYRRLVVSIAAGIGLQLGLDVTIQATQLYITGTRRHWDGRRSGGAVLSGLIGGIAGPVLFEGLSRALTRALGPRFGDDVGERAVTSLPGMASIGALTEYSAEQLADLIMNGRIQQSDDPWAPASAGAVEGVVDWVGHRSRRGDASAGLDGDVGKIDLPGWDVATRSGGDVFGPAGPGGPDRLKDWAAARGKFTFDGVFSPTGSWFKGRVTFTGVVDLPDGRVLSGHYTATGQITGVFDGVYTRPDLRIHHDAIIGQVTGTGRLDGLFDVSGVFTASAAGPVSALASGAVRAVDIGRAADAVRAGAGARPVAARPDSGPAVNTAVNTVVVRTGATGHADADVLPALFGQGPSGVVPESGGQTAVVGSQGSVDVAGDPTVAESDAASPAGAGRAGAQAWPHDAGAPGGPRGDVSPGPAAPAGRANDTGADAGVPVDVHGTAVGGAATDDGSSADDGFVAAVDASDGVDAGWRGPAVAGDLAGVVRHVPAGLALLDAGQAVQRAAAAGFRAQAGQYVVFAHGDRHGPVAAGRVLSAERLAGLITADARSHGKDVVLVQCDAATGTGRSVFARRLFDLLPRHNRRVLATAGTAWVPPPSQHPTTPTEVLVTKIMFDADGRGRLTGAQVREYTDDPRNPALAGFGAARAVMVIEHGSALSQARTHPDDGANAGVGAGVFDAVGDLPALVAGSGLALQEPGTPLHSLAPGFLSGLGWAAFPHTDPDGRPLPQDPHDADDASGPAPGPSGSTHDDAPGKRRRRTPTEIRDAAQAKYTAEWDKSLRLWGVVNLISNWTRGDGDSLRAYLNGAVLQTLASETARVLTEQVNGTGRLLTKHPAVQHGVKHMLQKQYNLRGRSVVDCPDSGLVSG